MEKSYDVIGMGELLIDFTMNGLSEQGNNLLGACPGGAISNVLSMLSKLGRKTAFIGKVGNYQFGRLLGDTLVEVGIDYTGPVVDEKVNTTLAFVHTFANAGAALITLKKGAIRSMPSPEMIDELIVKQL